MYKSIRDDATVGQFVSAWGQATRNLVKAGFLLEADENELTQSVVHSQIGK
jgi:hypothetical protein